MYSRSAAHPRVSLRPAPPRGHAWRFPCERERDDYRLARPYEGNRWRSFRAVVGSLGISYEEFTFIDVGCGKGRALLLASEFPFRRLVGLELSEEVATVARENMESYRGRGRPGSAEILVADAMRYTFPPEPSVVYLFNPIQGQGLARVAANLERSLPTAPRPLLVCYEWPEFREAFDRSPAFQVVGTSERRVIYGARLAPSRPVQSKAWVKAGREWPGALPIPPALVARDAGARRMGGRDGRGARTSSRAPPVPDPTAGWPYRPRPAAANPSAGTRARLEFRQGSESTLYRDAPPRRTGRTPATL